MSAGSHFEAEGDLRRYEALLAMADLMVHHGDLPELLLAMAERLRQVVVADAAHFSLYDPINNAMRLYLWQGSEVPQEIAVDASPSGWSWQTQEPLVVNDLQLESRFPLVLNRLREQGLKSYCFGNRAGRRAGRLGTVDTPRHLVPEPVKGATPVRAAPSMGSKPSRTCFAICCCREIRSCVEPFRLVCHTSLSVSVSIDSRESRADDFPASGSGRSKARL